MKKTLIPFIVIFLGAVISAFSQGNNWKLSGNNLGINDWFGSSNAADLIFKSNNLEIMRINTSGLVGIGTTHPLELLDVNGNIRATGTVYANGGLVVGTFKQGIAIVTTSLGVGTNNPTQQVDVVGNIKASGTVYADLVRTDSLQLSKPLDLVSLHVTNQLKVGNSVIITGINDHIYTDDFAALNIQSTSGYDYNTIINANNIGNVGIGTSSPTAKLEVAGQIKITGGSPGAHKILASDADGLAAWTTISAVDGVTTTCNTVNTLPKMSGSANIIECSQIYDDGLHVGIGTSNPQNNLHLNSAASHTNLQITNTSTGTTANDGLLIGTVGVNSFLDSRSGDLFIQNISNQSPCPTYNTIINGNNNGKVGIGTIPSTDGGIKLHVKGFTCIGTLCAACGIPPPAESTIFRLEDEVTGDVTRNAWWDFVASGANSKLFVKAKSNDGINAYIMTLTESGNVGIATTTPDARLTIDASAETVPLGLKIIRNNNIEFTVSGTGNTTIDGNVAIVQNGLNTSLIYQNGDARFDGEVRAKAIHIKADVWSDNVFNSNYKLLSLNEVEEFINKNKHLPDIPTESEVKKNGIDQGQYNALMLQKIEELTLYVIQLEKANKKLAAEIELLK